jgi:hypothetical protein
MRLDATAPLGFAVRSVRMTRIQAPTKLHDAQSEVKNMSDDEI